MSGAREIEDAIGKMPPGRAFTAKDFSGVTNGPNAGNILRRLCKRGIIQQAMRGVYYRPRMSDLLGINVPPGPDEIARAIARANKWKIAPCGDTALNQLGLDEQVPAVASYVSTGPYKMYFYQGMPIEFRHRASRDLLECSDITCAVVQALKAIGKDRVDGVVVSRLARSLSSEQVDTLVEESRGLTSWVTKVIGDLKGEKDAQNCKGNSS